MKKKNLIRIDSTKPYSAFRGRQIINQIVDRCHVGDSELSVTRYVISRLRDKHRTFFSLPKSTRRGFLFGILCQHRNNRAVYRRVMTGSK